MALLSKKHSCSPACVVAKWVTAVLLLLVAIAALVGVYMTHTNAGTLQFGSTSGSLAIIAFTLSVMAWGKQIACCMSGNCEVCK